MPPGRERQGSFQGRIAEECGLHRTYVGGIERGERNPALLNIRRIAVALGVKVRDLFPDF